MVASPGERSELLEGELGGLLESVRVRRDDSARSIERHPFAVVLDPAALDRGRHVDELPVGDARLDEQLEDVVGEDELGASPEQEDALAGVDVEGLHRVAAGGMEADRPIR